jgi:cytochrome c551/c552
MACQITDRPFLAASFQQIADRYRKTPDSSVMLENRLSLGGKTDWGDMVTPLPADLGGPTAPEDARTLIQWVLSWLSKSRCTRVTLHASRTENLMRITLHLDTFDRVSPCAYAILWLDQDTHKWSREGHVCLDLPEWGSLKVDAGTTLISVPDGTRSLCVLEGLKLDGRHGPFEGETGTAHWCGYGSAPGMSGHWHVQCVDTEATRAEHGVFAGEDGD